MNALIRFGEIGLTLLALGLSGCQFKLASAPPPPSLAQPTARSQTASKAITLKLLPTAQPEYVPDG